MLQNIIDVSFDVEKFTSQQKIIFDGLLSIYEKGKVISGNIIAPGSAGGWTELTAKVNAHQKAISDLQSANLRYAQTTQQVAAANTQNAQSTAAQSTATKEQTQSLQQNIDARNRAKNSMASYIASQKEDLELLKKGVITRAEYNKRMIDSDIKVEQFKNKISSLNSEIKSQTKTTQQLGGAYGILSKEYIKAQANAKNLAVQYGIESKEAKTAAASANALSDKLKAIDATVGQHQRNVGNYTSALGKLGAGFENVFRRIIEYVSVYAVINFFKSTVTEAMEAEKAVARFKATLDNLGRADVFERLETKAQGFADQFRFLRKEQVTGVFEQLITYGKLTENQITNLLPVITNFAAKQRITIEEATPIIIKALEGQARGLKAYGINVKDAHSVTERLGIVMNELGPKVEGAAEAFGKTTQGKIAKTKEDFTLLKEEIGNGLLPVINKLLNGVDGLIGKFRTMSSDVSFSTSTFGKWYDKLKSLLPAISPGDALNKHLQDEMARKFGGKQIENSENVFIQPEDINPNGNKVLGTGGHDDDDHKKEKRVAAVKESVTPALDLEFELYKINQQRKLKVLDEEANDTKRSYNERMVFAQEYYTAQIELTAATSKHEIALEEEKLKALEANLKKTKGTGRNNLLIEIENEKKQIQISRAKMFDEDLASLDAYNKRKDQIAIAEAERQAKILTEAEKSVKNVHENEKEAIQASHASTMASLDKLLKDGKIKQDFYDSEKAKSVKNAEVMQLQSDLRMMESMRNIMVLRHEDTKLIDKQIDKQKSLIISGQNTTDGKPLEKKDVPTLDESAKKIADSSKDLVTGLVDIKYQKEIDAIQKIIDLNNQRKEQEIANINASTLSNQEKAAQMIVLDNTVAANNRKHEREKAAIAIKQAKFDRDMAILSIMENAAIAIISLPAKAGIAGIAAGIAIGVTAAAQIAMLLAKPLPTMPAYAEGTANHPGGPAIVGEGKYKELVSSPDGKSFIASRPMLMNNLAKGSKVIPLTSGMVMEGMTQGANMTMAERIVFSNKMQMDSNRVELTAIKDAVYETGRMTAQAFRKRPPSNINIYVDTKWEAYISKTVKE